MTTLTIEVSDELLERLKSLARENSTSLNELVKDVLVDYVDDETWENEPTTEEIEQMINEANQEFETGNLRSLGEVLDELEEEIKVHADKD